MQTEGIDVRSVGNSATLHETALVEAFNLKAAIEYQLKNYEGAQEALTDMPPRGEEELDCVTLHNQVSCLGLGTRGYILQVSCLGTGGYTSAIFFQIKLQSQCQNKS